MTNSNKQDITLDYILYIYYLIYFWKINNYVKALINSGSRVNTIIFSYSLKLSFLV